MARKAARLTPEADVASEYLEGVVAELGNVRRRKMFGGYGIFEGDAMFALVTSQGDAYLKVSDANRQQFDEAGSVKFGGMPYFSIPDAVLADEMVLRDWAVTSIEVSRQTKVGKR